MLKFWDMKNPWIVVGLITVILFGGAIWYSSVAGERNNEGVEIVEHIKGNPDATVTLVEYSDLQCPACAAFAPAVKEVLDKYGAKVRFEYKHYPLPIHNLAVQASVAAEAAGQQDAFFEFHDLLFENQKEWSTQPNPQASFIRYAEELNLDVDLFRRHLNSSLLRDKVQAEVGEGRELGITGTPTFFLNGELMEIQTFQDFVEQVATAVDPEATGATETSETAPVSEENVRFGL